MATSSLPQWPSGRLLPTALLGGRLLASGCAGVHRQVEESENFKDCTFALQSVEQTTLGGVDVRKAVANGGLGSVGIFALGLADRRRQPTRAAIGVRLSVKFLCARA